MLRGYRRAHDFILCAMMMLIATLLSSRYDARRAESAALAFAYMRARCFTPLRAAYATPPMLLLIHASATVAMPPRCACCLHDMPRLIFAEIFR